MRLRKIDIALVVVGLIAMTGFMHHASASGSKHYQPQTVTPATAQARPTTPGQVAGVQTAITAPEGVQVTVNDTRVKTKPPVRQKPAKTTAPELPAPGQSVTTPTVTTPIPTPETVIVNLKTPMEYTLRRGERSPQLEHVMTDGVRYEWTPGAATIWQNEVPDADTTVWAMLSVDKPAGTYVSDRLPFTLEAAADAKPGTYETKIIIRIHEHATMGVPVVVTVTE